MDHKAALLALVLVSASLAGCAGDPDEGGGDEFDADALQDLIDENLQDFLNNTSITVNNHYYNNTTYVVDENYYSTINEYNNTTYMDGGEIYNYVTENSNYSYGFGQGVNGTIGSSGLLFVVDLEWDAMDMFPEYNIPGDRNNSFEVTWTYWDYPTNQERTDTFEFDCSEYYLFESNSQNSSWGAYWESSDPYYDAWDNQYNDTIADILQSVAWTEFIQGVCNDDYVPSGAIAEHVSSPAQRYEYSFLNITVPEGFAIAYRQELFFVYRGGSQVTNDYSYYTISEGHQYAHPMYASSFVSTDFYLYGGWEDITIEFSMYPGYYDNLWIYSDSSYHYILYYELIPVMQHIE